MKILSVLVCLAMLCIGKPVNAHGESPVKVGDKAPAFSLQDQDGHIVSLNDYADQNVVVLYFYPKDGTPVCTAEACTFRDQFDAFTKSHAEVLGISGDSVSSHKHFADQHKLQFKLLSDRDNAVRKAYGVPSTMGVQPGRVTYVIDKKGTVRLVFNSQIRAKMHVQEALRVIDELNHE